MHGYDYEYECEVAVRSIIGELMRERDRLLIRIEDLEDALEKHDYQWLVMQEIISKAAGDYLSAVAQSHAEDQMQHRVAPLGDD